ncbi:MAG: L-seryl-tRNA(Sec) selenium transferase [Terriglobales bacterium]
MARAPAQPPRSARARAAAPRRAPAPSPPPAWLRQIPSVDALLRRPALAELWRELGPAGARRVIAGVLAEVRAAPFPDRLAALEPALRAAAARRLAPSLRPVLNATGVLLHTNLGRAPLARAAVERVAAVAAGYSTLEFDLGSGRRARRDRHLAPLLAELTGAEQTIVVNNNAAAMLLALNTLARDAAGEVLISRGELVEIGESFRIADIVARGGARLVEVGATNRTRLRDFQQALTSATRLIVRVHRSNFEMRGYVGQPTLAELAAWARQVNVPLLEDLGSGCLQPLPGLPPSPLVAASIAAGVDVVTYSGDKLLGGPQAGLISGRAALLAPMRANPLFRALRPGKLSLAALEATLALYARGALEALPLAAMASAADLEARARRLAAQLPPALEADVRPGRSVTGGGALPGESLATWLVTLPERFAAPLRLGEPAVVARVADGRCRLDLRTVPPEDDGRLLAALCRLEQKQGC